MKKKYPYQILSTLSEKLGRFEIIQDIIKTQSGNRPYSYVKVKPCVGILAFDEENRVLLIRQFRHALGSWELEIPGGMIDNNETPEITAFRELQEETGYVAEKMILLGCYYPSPGSTTEICYLFAAFCRTKRKINLDPLEILSVEMVTIDQLRHLINDDIFRHGMGLAAWAKYQLKGGFDNVNKTDETRI